MLESVKQAFRVGSRNFDPNSSTVDSRIPTTLILKSHLVGATPNWRLASPLFVTYASFIIRT
jgi:hypothetical protein